MEAAHTLTLRSRVDSAAWSAAPGRRGAVSSSLFLGSGSRSAAIRCRCRSCSASASGCSGSLALALARFDAAVALGVLLLAVVRIEPAPSDLIFAVVIAVAFAVGSFDLERVPVSVITLVGAFLALNLLSAIGAVDPGRAAEFFAITLYLGILGALAHELRVLGPPRAPRPARVPHGRRALRGRRLCRALRALPGRRGVRRRAARPGAVQGPERLRAVPRPGRADPDGGDRRAASPALAAVDEARPAVDSDGRGRVLVLARRLAQPRRRASSSCSPSSRSAEAAGARRSCCWPSGSSRPRRSSARWPRPRRSSFLEQRADPPGLRRPALRRPGHRASRSPPSIRSGSARASSRRPPRSPRTARTSARSPSRACWASSSSSASCVLTLGFAARNAALGRDTYGIGSAALLAAWCGVVANSAFVDTLHWRHLWLVAALIWAGTALRTGYPGR